MGQKYLKCRRGESTNILSECEALLPSPTLKERLVASTDAGKVYF